jgi:hypothetical protein
VARFRSDTEPPKGPPAAGGSAPPGGTPPRETSAEMVPEQPFLPKFREGPGGNDGFPATVGPGLPGRPGPATYVSL